MQLGRFLSETTLTFERLATLALIALMTLLCLASSSTRAAITNVADKGALEDLPRNNEPIVNMFQA